MIFSEMDPAVDIRLDAVREQVLQRRHREAVLRHFTNKNKFGENEKKLSKKLRFSFADKVGSISIDLIR